MIFTTVPFKDVEGEGYYEKNTSGKTVARILVKASQVYKDSFVRPTAEQRLEISRQKLIAQKEKEILNQQAIEELKKSSDLPLDYTTVK